MIIKENTSKYSISAMSKLLKVSRSIVYYKEAIQKQDLELECLIQEIFNDNWRVYGTRKIKNKLKELNYIVSRRKIARIMKKHDLVSKYAVKQYKKHKESPNEDKIANLVNREFDYREKLEVAVSDLTYVNVKGKWNYICTIIDLYNREIIGYKVGKKKNALLVNEAFATITKPLYSISIFHTDRGNEFKNVIIDDLLDTFKIERSLSHKGCPYDNAVAEAAFKIIKTEFVDNRIFNSLEQLEIEFFDYVNWYNNMRIHGSLYYLTPVEYGIKMAE